MEKERVFIRKKSEFFEVKVKKKDFFIDKIKRN